MQKDAEEIFQKVREAMAAGDHGEACALLNQIMQTPGYEPQYYNNAVWHFCYVAETAEARMDYVQKALVIWRENPRVLNRLKQLKAELLQEAKQAAAANNLARAEVVLRKLAEVDEHNEDVWWFWSEIATTDEQRIRCLIEVTRINPDNEQALRKLEELSGAAQAAASPDQNEPPVAAVAQPKSDPRPQESFPHVSSSEKTITRWSHPFRKDTDIQAGFVREVNELLEIAESLPERPVAQILELQDAKALHKDWKPGEETPQFLFTAVAAAAGIAENLLEVSRPADAFWAANVFGEICKYITPFDRERGITIFRRLLAGACHAVRLVQKQKLSAEPESENMPELDRLWREIVEACSRPALRLFINSKSYRTQWEKIYDDLGQEVVDETLAQDFDESLHELGQHDPEGAKNYLARNLGATRKLKLSEHWSAKREQWERAYTHSFQPEPAPAPQPPAKPAEATEAPAQPATPSMRLTPDWAGNTSGLFKAVMDDIENGHLDEAVKVLRQRIAQRPGYHSNYVVLAAVLEHHYKDIDGAFRTLRDHLFRLKRSRQGNQVNMTGAYRKLLNFCRRNRRPDLGQKAYHMAREAHVSQEVLRAFEAFAPKAEQLVQHTVHGETGIFIDHPNFLMSLELLNQERGHAIPIGDQKVQWLTLILRQLLDQAKKRFSKPAYKVSVAFWSHMEEAQLVSAYIRNRFALQEPEEIKAPEQAVDFKLADEVRRAQLQAFKSGTTLGQVIIVSGDGDFAQLVSSLVDEGVTVQMWGGGEAMNRNYAEIIGENNMVKLDTLCGF